MSSVPPPPSPDHDPAAPPPRPAAGSAPWQTAHVKRARTPEEAIDAEVRSNLIGTAIFISLIVLLRWASGRPGPTEAINEVGSVLLILADLAALVLITLEPFHLKRKNKAAAGGGQ